MTGLTSISILIIIKKHKSKGIITDGDRLPSVQSKLNLNKLHLLNEAWANDDPCYRKMVLIFQ